MRPTRFLSIALFWSLSISTIVGQKNITRPNIVGPNGFQVNSYTGALFVSRQDMIIKGQGLPIDIRFSYNEVNYNIDEGYGKGWSFSYGMNYQVDTASITVEKMDGSVSSFFDNGSGYDAEPGVFEILEEYQSGKFRMTTTNGTKYFFDDASHKKLTKIEDRSGNQVLLSYTDSLLTSISDPSGRDLTLAWTDGRLVEISHNILTEPRIFTFSYVNGHLAEVTNPDGCVIKYRYNDAGYLSKSIDENGNAIDVIYNSNGSVSSIISCVNSMSITYNTPSRETYVVQSVSGRNLTTVYKFDESGRVLEKSGNCCGYNVGYAYDDNNNITAKTDGNGNVNTYEYDISGNIIRETGPLGNSILYTYEPGSDRVTSMTDKRGNTATYTYDAQGNLIQKDMPLGITESFTYDEFGNMLSMVNGRGDTTTYTYDVYGNVTTKTDPEGGVHTFVYDDLNNMISKTDANNNTYTYEYDLLNRLIRITDPLSNEVTYAYDCRGNKLLETNANQDTTTYIYDGLDRLVTVISPAGKTINFEYDEFSNIAKRTDGNGNTTSFEYNLRRQLTSETDPMGFSETMDYDDFGNKIKETDKNGNVTTYAYDVLNRLITITDPLGNTIEFTYDPNGNVISKTDQLGNTMFFEYDELNRVVRETDPLNFSMLYSYDANGNKVTETDKRGFVTQYTYDKNDRLVEEARPLGNITTSTYDANGNKLSETNPLNNTTTFTYDALDRMLSETNALGETTSYTYDPVGNLLSVGYPNGRVEQFTYNEDNQILTEFDNLGTLRTYSYDNNYNLLTETDGNNNALTYLYNARNEQIGFTDDLGGRVLYEYDGNSNLVSMTDRNGNETNYSYDALNRKVATTNALGVQTAYQYDAVGNKISITDEEGRTIYFQYDPVKQLTRETHPNGTSSNFIYDANGNIIERINFDDAATTYTYDELNRLLTKNYPDGTINSYTYDALGRLLTAVNSNANLSFSYDNANRLIEETLNGKTTVTAYDIPGRKKTITYPGGMIVEEEYDVRERALVIQANNNIIASYTYDPGNRMLTKTYGNNTVNSYSYNANSQITDITVNPGQLIHFSYDYDAEGNRIQEEKAHRTDQSEQYNYDPLNRLIDLTKGTLVNGSITSPVTSKQFGYDGLGNRNLVTENGANTSYSTNILNQYTSVTNSSGTVNLSSDANGNLISNGIHTYTYDPDHRLIEVDGGSTAYYFYDALGRRIQKIAGGMTVNFYYDTDHIIEERDASDALIANYVYGQAIDDRIALFKSGTVYYYHHNAIGSTVGLTDINGSVVERYEYDDYGKVHFYNANYTSIPSSVVGNRFLFTGREYDPETGFYYYRARHYDPILGRFIQRDPIGFEDGNNLYEYVNSNPVTLFDPMGLLADCRTYTYRKGISLGIFHSAAAYFGLQQFSFLMDVTIQECGGCCGKSPGTSISMSITGKIQAEFGPAKFPGAPPITPYGRAGGGVKGYLDTDPCGETSGGACFSGSVEIGLSLSKDLVVGEGGVRGGLNGTYGGCIKCKNGHCEGKCKACLSARARAWWKVKWGWYSLTFFKEWEWNIGCWDVPCPPLP